MPAIATYLKQEIQAELRLLFHQELPEILHQLSQESELVEKQFAPYYNQKPGKRVPNSPNSSNVVGTGSNWDWSKLPSPVPTPMKQLSQISANYNTLSLDTGGIVDSMCRGTLDSLERQRTQQYENDSLKFKQSLKSIHHRQPNGHLATMAGSSPVKPRRRVIKLNILQGPSPVTDKNIDGKSTTSNKSSKATSGTSDKLSVASTGTSESPLLPGFCTPNSSSNQSPFLKASQSPNTCGNSPSIGTGSTFSLITPSSEMRIKSTSSSFSHVEEDSSPSRFDGPDLYNPSPTRRDSLHRIIEFGQQETPSMIGLGFSPFSRDSDFELELVKPKFDKGFYKGPPPVYRPI